MEIFAVFSEGFLSGAEVVFSLYGILFVILGVVLGTLIGATPGLSPSMGVALLVPLSFQMPPALAFVFFVAVYQASNYGGSITAILLNAPGTPSAVVTAIDGYPLTKKGQPDKALFYAVFSSAIGGLVGGTVLILFAVPIASFGLLFGPAEYFALAFLGLATVVGFQSKDYGKGVAAIGIGLLLSCVGTDPFTGEERLTFGNFDLYDGVSFIPVMIGLFALAEIFHRLELKQLKGSPVELKGGIQHHFSELTRLWKKIARPLFQSSFLGTIIGVVPGAGSAVASFISYGQAKHYAVDREEFGEGALGGVIASEAANSSSVGGALVPLVALGIPGSATDAVLLGALALHGLVAGPELITNSPDIVYGIFLSVILANLFIFVFGLYGNRLFSQVVRIPTTVLFPLIIALSFLGSYTIRNTFLDCWICLGAGVFGWFGKRIGIPAAPIVLGLVLGNMLEMNFRRVLVIGGVGEFLTRPGALVMLIIGVFFIVKPFLGSRKVIH